MFKLKLISLFLALVMAIQVLPLAEIGFALGSYKFTEEIPHGMEKSGKAESEDLFIKHFITASHNHLASNHIDANVIIYIHTSEKIPSNHSIDVVSPPPDSSI